MPPSPTDFALSDVLTIVGILLAVAVQTIAAFRWINKRFEERDASLQGEVLERQKAVTSLQASIAATREHGREQDARIEREFQRELAGLRERLAVMPTRKDLDEVVRERVLPLESDLRALVVELARLGMHNPSRKVGDKQDRSDAWA